MRSVLDRRSRRCAPPADAPGPTTRRRACATAGRHRATPADAETPSRAPTRTDDDPECRAATLAEPSRGDLHAWRIDPRERGTRAEAQDDDGGGGRERRRSRRCTTAPAMQPTANRRRALMASAALVSAVSERAGHEAGLHRHRQPRARRRRPSANSRAIAGPRRSPRTRASCRAAPQRDQQQHATGMIATLRRFDVARRGICRLRWTKLPIGFNCDSWSQASSVASAAVILGGAGVLAQEPATSAEAGARRDPRVARRRRRGPNVHRRRRRRAARRRRQRHRRRRCVDLRRGGRRDLAFRSRRRGSHHHLFRARRSASSSSTGRDRRRKRRDARRCSRARTRYPVTGRSAPRCRRRSTPPSIALAKFGTKSLSDVLQPAIALADGFPMYEFLHHYLETERAACEPYAWTMRTYYPDGRITPVGEMFRQPNLAATLRPDVDGRAGDARARARRANRRSRPGATRSTRARSRADIAGGDEGSRRRDDGGGSRRRTTARSRSRLSVPYRGYTVYKTGFWNQGPALLQTLRILEGFDLARDGRRAPSTRCTRRSRRSSWRMPTAIATTAIRTSSGCPATCCCRSPTRALRRALIDPSRASLEQRPGDPLNAKALTQEAGIRRARTRDSGLRPRPGTQGGGRHDVGAGGRRRRQPVLGDTQLGLAAGWRVRGRAHGRADEQPDAGVQPRSDRAQMSSPAANGRAPR